MQINQKGNDMTVIQNTALMSHINSLINHLIRWTKDHDLALAPSVQGLCEGTMPKKTASSLRAILCAFSHEVVLEAIRLLTEVESFHGPIPDVLLDATVSKTKRGYVLQSILVGGVV